MVVWLFYKANWKAASSLFLLDLPLPITGWKTLGQNHADTAGAAALSAEPAHDPGAPEHNDIFARIQWFMYFQSSYELNPSPLGLAQESHAIESDKALQFHSKKPQNRSNGARKDLSPLETKQNSSFDHFLPLFSLAVPFLIPLCSCLCSHLASKTSCSCSSFGLEM